MGKYPMAYLVGLFFFSYISLVSQHNPTLVKYCPVSQADRGQGLLPVRAAPV